MENNAAIPEKFRNADGTLNAGQLMKSYAELEKKIGAMASVPDENADPESIAKFRRAIGVPESADEYPDNPMFADAAEIKEKFREMGLTKKQAGDVCKMAEDLLAPVVRQIMSAHGESACMSDLREFFGSDEKMPRMLAGRNRQLCRAEPAARGIRDDGLYCRWDQGHL